MTRTMARTAATAMMKTRESLYDDDDDDDDDDDFDDDDYDDDGDYDLIVSGRCSQPCWCALRR